jgi:hypothetical protein
MGIELPDGVYYSREKPKIYDADTFDLTKHVGSLDYYCAPYQADYVFVWDKSSSHGRPINLSYEGQGNRGSAIVSYVSNPGYIAVCMEND